MRDRRKEGQLIKRAVLKALPTAHRVSVKAGKGTSWGWWTITIETAVAGGCYCYHEPSGIRKNCQPCKDKWRHMYDTAQKAAVDSGADISYYSPDMGGKVASVNVEIELLEESEEDNPALAMVTEIVDNITQTKAARSTT